MLLLVTFALSVTLEARAQFVHPGALHTQAGFDRMAAKVAAGASPWIDSYNMLIADNHAQLSWNPAPVTTLVRTNGGGNFTRSQQDAQAIYDLAIRYRISGDSAFADRAIVIMDAWSSTLTSIDGDSNQYLASGICGYLFAIAGETLRGYSGWSDASRTAYSDMLVNIFYPKNHDFIIRHNNTCFSHYRCNWDASNMASMIAIGVLADRQDIFDEAVNYFQGGIGNGDIDRAVIWIHPNGLGQNEESGRDQPHAMGGFDSLTMLAEIAWNQGVDLYGYENNRLLRGLEYLAKYNLNIDVPYEPYQVCDQSAAESVVSPSGRGGMSPQAWERSYNHYVNRMGLAAPNVAQYAALLRPDGPPNQYGTHPSRFDWFGLGSLTFYLDPIAMGETPSGLMASVEGQQITLAWWGSAYANDYNVKRSEVSGGPHVPIGMAGAADTSYVDSGLTEGTTYYYVVSANNPDGEGPDSTEVSAVAGTSLPSPWLSADIGAVGLSGAGSYNYGTATFTLKGSGSDIWGTADTLEYVYRSMTGDGTIVARLATFHGGGGWAKSGVMMRETLGADSANALMSITKANGANFQYRISTGGTSANAPRIAGVGVPQWVKLVRAGDTFTGFYSADGATWTEVGSVIIPTASTLYVGLTVCNNNNTWLGTYRFDSVTLSGCNGRSSP
jgi:hypothetical protein